MKTRKDDKADLENKRGLFRDLGLVVGLGIILWAFTYKSYPEGPASLEMDDVIIDEEVIPMTQRELKPPPPPPPAPPEVLQVVEDDIEIKEIELESTEIDEDTEIALIEEVEEATDEVFNFVNVENKPVFPGCEDEPTEDARFACFNRQMQVVIANNFKFPELSRQMGSQGRVWVDFVIEKDGRVSNVRVARTSGDENIDKEAVRVVREHFPKMTPAKSGGRPVRMSYTVPINARLQ